MSFVCVYGSKSQPAHAGQVRSHAWQMEQGQERGALCGRQRWNGWGAMGDSQQCRGSMKVITLLGEARRDTEGTGRLREAS